MDPTYTTNMTGLRICRRGVSFRKESITACHTMARSKRGEPSPSLSSHGNLTSCMASIWRCSTIGPRPTLGRTSAPDEDDDADQEHHEEGVCVGACPRWPDDLFRAATCDGQGRTASQ